MDEHFLLLTLIVLVGNITEAVTGFGSTVIAVTLGAHLYPIHYLVPIFVPLNIIISGYFVLRYNYAIEHSVLWGRILPLTIPGILLGISIFNFAQNTMLKIAYGVFIVGFSTYELAHILRASKQVKPKPLSPLQSALCLTSGGIMQAIYLSGGPLVVYYASRKLLNKRNFRSTLSALWLVLNIFLLISHVFTGKTTFTTLKASGMLLPALLAGIVIGEWLHHRIPEKTFRILVFLLLIVAGASLIIKG